MNLFITRYFVSRPEKYFVFNRLFVFGSIFLLMNIYDVQGQEARKLIVEAIEYPGRDLVMWDGLYAASDGKVYSGLINEGVSAHFYVYDPVEAHITTGEVSNLTA